MKKFIFKIVFLFCLTFILTFPLNFDYLVEVNQYTIFFSERIIDFLATTVFNSELISTKLLSDSKALYIHTFFLICFSFFLACIWELYERFVAKKRVNYKKLNYWFFVILRYYLSLVLLQYGFAKLFKTQFYLPEPNTLFTPLGFLDKDILYWSAIGSSTFYTIFGGFLEVVVAILLLFRRTYVLASLLAVLLVSHIIAINIGFNISVKLFSSFLFLISCILVSPQLKALFYFFFSQKAISLKQISISYPTKKAKIVYVLLKSIVLIWLGIISLYPYFLKGNFDDDTAKRPKLHGAYRVISNELKNMQDSTNYFLLPTNTKRIFIHRKNYLITENENDEFVDYKIDHKPNQIQVYYSSYLLTNKIDFTYTFVNDSIVEFNSDWQQIKVQKIDWKNLPLLNDNLDWTVD